MLYLLACLYMKHKLFCAANVGENCTDVVGCSDEPYPCYNNGTCIQLDSGTISCSCVPGTQGSLCQLTVSAGFSGNQVLEVPVQQEDGALIVQFEFQTTVPAGVLLLYYGVCLLFS